MNTERIDELYNQISELPEHDRMRIIDILNGMESAASDEPIATDQDNPDSVGTPNK